MKKLFVLYFVTFQLAIIAQHSYDPLSPPNTYRNLDNPNYWKNKMPHAGYWQQDVHYEIKASIDEKTDILTATQILTYWNNSPDDLDFVYFHLYQNAFQPGSYYDDLQKQNGVNPNYGKYESQGLGTVVENIKVNGIDVKSELDNTILKVYLPKTLISGGNIKFSMNFKTYFEDGEVRRRMKVFDSWGFRHYNGVHWYPRICVYDSKFGWTKDQHLGKEFYGDFGCFDVELTFASNYVVDGTGYMLNRDEVYPEDLRKKLDINNFKNKPWNSPPSIITKYTEGETKTFKFHAENVHDFGFTANPNYRIGEKWWEDKVSYSLVQEPHASRWQNAAEFSAKCIQIFSEDFGRYTYHKMIVADADDGMEYPMMTLDRGSDPGYRGLLAHEIGHNWFFGQVGNNETYRALLDEGFAQFLTAWALIKIDGENLVRNKPHSKYKQKYFNPVKAIDNRVYYSYINDATKQNDPIISTHSDCFNGALGHGGGYRHVYYKTAAMLYNLQYVLGDELFLKAMKNYFETWKIAHPYTEDFRNSIIQFTRVDLNWFFDQWLETEKRIDYGVTHKNNTVTFTRYGRMQMPIDFTVTANDGKTYDYHIPNHWFIKKTNAIILEKWHAWDLLQPKYKVTLNIPSGIKEVKIDPSNRLADSYMPNNSSKGNITLNFNDNLWEYADWKNYEVKYQPNIWWNSTDGIKFGLNISGGYLRHHHLFDATIWMNSGIAQDKENPNYSDFSDISYRTSYNTNLDNLYKNSRFYVYSSHNFGLLSNKLSLVKEDKKDNSKISVNLISLYRPKNSSDNYFIHEMEKSKLNNRIDICLEREYKYSFGKANFKLDLKTSTLGSDYNYSSISVTAINKNKSGKIKINTRAFLQYGRGSNWAKESLLGLAGANPEELYNNKFTRTNGVFNSNDFNFTHELGNYHSGGGLNLRGYAGYLAPEYDKNGILIRNTNYGTSGASLSTEVDFSSVLPYSIRRSGIGSYLFADAGVINIDDINRKNYITAMSDIRADAGIGFIYTHRNWGPLEKPKPLIIRLDLPLFLNRPPYLEEYYQIRWILGIGKSF